MPKLLSMPMPIGTPHGTLRVQWLGQPHLWRDGVDLCHTLPVKQQALLFVLALDGPTLSRLHLCALLWEALPESVARANLRVALSHLRREWPEGLCIDAHQVTLRVSSGLAPGLAQFEPPMRWDGGLLAGFDLPEAEAFSRWLASQRQRAESLALQTWRARLQQAHTAGDAVQAMRCARQMLDIDSADEAAHMVLMRGLALQGERTAALRQYQACCTALADQFGARPSARCYALYVQIHADTLVPVLVDRCAPPASIVALASARAQGLHTH